MRPDGRMRLSPINTFLRWLRRIPIIRQGLDFTRHLTAPKIRIKQDTDFHPARHSDMDLLTIVSANLWHDWPRYRDLPDRLESLAQLIEDQGAQVVLLQEALRTPNISASEWLAERLNMVYGYVRANGEMDALGFEEGPAVLSRLPLGDVKAINLGSSAAPLVHRMALGAQIELECCKIWVVSTHLGFLQADNLRQMNQLRSWVSKLVGDGTAVIGGDFNAGESSKSIRMAREDWQDTYRNLNQKDDGHTHLLRLPWGGILLSHRIDYLFLKNRERDWSIVDAQHLTTEPLPYSDHKAVLARLRYKPSSG
jgi:endonuclease/exonuclease/phosphatase family metal-dependent hydrolase